MCNAARSLSSSQLEQLTSAIRHDTVTGIIHESTLYSLQSNELADACSSQLEQLTHVASEQRKAYNPKTVEERCQRAN